SGYVEEGPVVRLRIDVSEIRQEAEFARLWQADGKRQGRLSPLDVALIQRSDGRLHRQAHVIDVLFDVDVARLEGHEGGEIAGAAKSLTGDFLALEIGQI